MSTPLKSYTQYSELEKSELIAKYNEFCMMIQQGLDIFGIKSDDLEINKTSLLEIIQRVEKRRVYFWIYYGLRLSEKNEAAVYAYWLLKLSPLFDGTKPENDVNVKIALHILLSSITYVAGKSDHNLKLTSHYIRHLAYSLKFRYISKEAIMTVMESLLV